MAQLPSTPSTSRWEESSGGFLSSRWYYANQTLLLGITLAILGNFLISISLNLQKYSHVQCARLANQKPVYRSKLWWCGIILMGIGEMGNFAAYGFTSVMLVASLGSMAVLGSALISVLFQKEIMWSEGVLGGTLTIAGTFLLVTFAPHVAQEATARRIQSYLVSWQVLIYLILEIITFCILLYFYKRRDMKHVVALLTLAALLASPAIISAKAVASMIVLSVKGNMQLTYPIFYLMLIIMVLTCVFQVKFLSQAEKLYGATRVIPINYVFFTINAVVTGAVFYRELQGVSLLSGFMFLFGCLLSFVGVFLITQNRGKEHLTSFYIDYGHIPGKKMREKIQPDSNSLPYGSLCNEGEPVKTQN
ncbi:NIPA-like protein 2 [Eublepharis macularius]|uniref:NIPA-like protein 2 n=1 Tax=Eublepharis macularius TaxID=481883 RepID=A0AA97L713_EUBMA|nr:NIPA-like protein 2 [Eublepharis macularius]